MKSAVSRIGCWLIRPALGLSRSWIKKYDRAAERSDHVHRRPQALCIQPRPVAGNGAGHKGDAIENGEDDVRHSIPDSCQTLLLIVDHVV